MPKELGWRFSVQQARDAGVSAGRLRRADLDRPFHGIRALRHPLDLPEMDPYERQAAEHRVSARQYAPRLRPRQFLSHETAVALLGGPSPLAVARPAFDGPPVPLDGRSLPVHVSTLGDGPLVRAAGVRGHRADPKTTRIARADGVPIAHPTTIWCQLGSWPLLDLVALGDFFCRVWREGPGRPVGKQPLTTVDELAAALAAGRRPGIRRLRQALEFVREDSWSPRESKLRCHLVLAGLPEPTLNHDVYDDKGRFLGCVDLAYPERKIAIEYHGTLHHSRYAEDVERIAALRAAGWIVIEVTSALFARPDAVVARVRAALGL